MTNMKLFLSFAICYFTLIRAQQSYRRYNPYYNEAFSPDRIYFEDNGPGTSGVQQKVPNSGNFHRKPDVTQRIFSAYNEPSQTQSLAQAQAHTQTQTQAQAQVQSMKPTRGEILPSISKPYNKPEHTTIPTSDQKQDNNDSEPQRKPTSVLSRIDNVSLAVTNFGVNLIRNINELQPGNWVVSPYSIVILLGLLQQGATGSTLQEISRALQMPPDISAAAYKKLSNDIQKRSSQNILKIANNMFVANKFNINPNFEKSAIQNFGSEVTPTIFAEPDRVSQKINDWVAKNTDNKIEQLVSPDAIDINSQLVLVNTIYFKGLWEIKFRPEATKPREFTLSNGLVKVTPFMRMRRYFRTGVDRSNNAQVIILPFERDQYSLMVILPSKVSNVAGLLSKLTYSNLASYHNLTVQEVDLEIPKFTVRADTDLSTVLRKMGIVNLFTPYSELRGLGNYNSYSPQVSSAIHSAMLSIDEEGGVAAAATAFAVVALSYDDPSVIFKADRPFLTVLWDNQSALPLFMAKVEEPIF